MPKAKAVRHPITPEQQEKLRRLASARFLPGSWDKRFVRQIWGGVSLAEEEGGIPEITAAQAEWIDKLFQKYRRQTQRTPLAPC